MRRGEEPPTQSGAVDVITYISDAHNLVNTNADITAHAEMMRIGGPHREDEAVVSLEGFWTSS